MRAILKFFFFLISSVIRLIPFIILLLFHIFWNVYAYQLDPLKLLEINQIPTVFGDYIWIYVVVGLMVFIFLTLEFHFLAYGTFLGAVIGQNIYWLRTWERIITKASQPDLVYRWFAFIYGGLLIGFVLQCIFTGGRKVIKISQYNRLRRMNKKLASN